MKSLPATHTQRLENSDYTPRIGDSLRLPDSLAVASAIKSVRPHMPIVIIARDGESRDADLISVDAIVARSGGPYLLWAAVNFLMNSARVPGSMRAGLFAEESELISA